MMKIKTISFSMAVFLTSASVLCAQNTEQYQLDQGIGYNKYLKSTTPNAQGEYTLRMEAFVTGEVEEIPVPTDFILAIDGSGSMQYDIRVDGYSTSPNTIKGADIQKFKIDQRYADAFDGLQYYAYNGIYRGVKSGWDTSTHTWGNGDGYAFPTPFAENANCSRYYYSSADNTYYRILRGTGTEGSTTYYYLYFVRDNMSNGGSTTYYIFTANDGRMTYSTTLGANAKKVTSPSQIIVAPSVDPTISYNAADNNAWSRHFFRPQQRREALIEALDGFFDQLAAKNAEMPSSVTGHQVAMVSFTGRYNNTSNKDDITASYNTSYGYFQANQFANTSGYTPATSDNINAAPENSTRVIQGFTAVTESNKTAFKNRARRAIRFSGQANNHPNQGMRLARLLFQDLQSTKSNMGPLTAQGGPNRNKIVIMFTDEISKTLDNNDVAPVTGLSGVSGATYATFYEAKLIKAVRSSLTGTQINGKVFSVDYSTPGTTSVGNFLKYLSSNYPNGDYTQKTGDHDNSKYTGTQITPAASRIYYYNGVTTPLTEVFANILTKTDFGTVPSATLGDQVSTPLVMVDQLSDSFVIPSNLDGKVKYYTAQCIGTKTITDGAHNPYLAFASEVQAPSRGALSDLWVSSYDAGNLLVWENKGPIDIDNNLSYTVSADRKTFTVKGFNYGDLWCGYDPKHTNTRTLATTDPNYSYCLDGYRGFKLIVEFPIVLSEAAVGGMNVPTNDASAAGVYAADGSGNPTGSPIVSFPTPTVSFPVTLWIRKTGLRPGESAAFTIQKKPRSGSGSWVDHLSFILTGEETDIPEVKLLNLDPDYHYRIKESGWNWSYTGGAKDVFPSTEDASLTNPIVISNTFVRTIHVERGEGKATNVLGPE